MTPTTITERIFPSKLLLFGEYTIINYHQALAIPLDRFSGRWTLVKDGLHPSVPYLRDILSYLHALQLEEAAGQYDLQRFGHLLNQGLAFESDIPLGYGLGSSGALCAAIYDAFCQNKVPIAATQAGQLNLLRRQLAEIEHHFHGSSSGIDPVVSYLQRPVLTPGADAIEITGLPVEGSGRGGVFLLNTRRPRTTQPLVQLYLKKCENSFFERKCGSELASYNEDAIHAFLHADWEDLFELVHRISFFQFRYFEEMIPPVCPEGRPGSSLQQLWLDGLSTDRYKLKLCGAGGGGFVLGFCRNFARTEAALEGWELIRVFSF